MIDTERRSRLKGVSAAGKLKKNGAPPLDGGDGMMMQYWKQIAQPVCGRKGLKQAGFAWHGGSLIRLR